MLVDSWCSWWCSLYWGRRTSKARTCSAQVSSTQTSQVLNLLAIFDDSSSCSLSLESLWLGFGCMAYWICLPADWFRRWSLWCWSSRRRFLASEFNKGNKMFSIDYFCSVSSRFNQTCARGRLYPVLFKMSDKYLNVQPSLNQTFIFGPTLFMKKSHHVSPIWLNYLSIHISMVIVFQHSWLVLPRFILQTNLSNANLEGALVTGNTSFKGANITGAGKWFLHTTLIAISCCNSATVPFSNSKSCHQYRGAQTNFHSPLQNQNEQK